MGVRFEQRATSYFRALKSFVVCTRTLEINSLNQKKIYRTKNSLHQTHR